MSLTDFYYINSERQKIDFTKAPFIGEKSNDLLSYKWDYITQGQAVQKIVKFEKRMKEKKFHVLITADDERRYYGALEQFLQAVDVDINNLKMGRLYIGDYYLECYIFANSKPKRYLNTTKTLLECTAICERGNWQREFTFHFNTSGTHEENTQYAANGIIYPYDYMYDFSPTYGKNEIRSESYMDSDFEMVFRGAMDNPKIVIGGNTYEFIDCPIASDEKIIVNSKTKTALLYRNNGEIENVFPKRNREFNIYQKIKGDRNIVLLDDRYTVDVTLFYERSEPKWSSENWILPRENGSE